MAEHSIAVARASVMIYDDQNKKWVSAGSAAAAGIAKVMLQPYKFDGSEKWP